MRAALVERAGDPAQIAFRNISAPGPTPEEVLIDVAAAGIGYLDVVCARGDHQLRPNLPFTPGFEIAGRVASSPVGVPMDIGDPVMAYVDFGGCAEHAVAQPGLVLPIPQGMSIIEAAATPVNALTALYALVSRAKVRPSELVLVHGASGGLGMAVTQVARHLRAEAWGVVSSEAKRKLAQEAGASKVFLIDDDWIRQIRKAAGKRGSVDVVVDPVGGNRLTESLRCLAPGGRLVSLGFVAGVPSVPVNRLLVRNANLLGVDWDPEDESTSKMLVPELLKMLATGSFRAIGVNEFGLEELPAVLAALARRDLVGKAVVRL